MAAALLAAGAGLAYGANTNSAALSQTGSLVPGRATKADVRALLGAPWRVVQFNDCGMAIDDQADETWEYRGTGPAGGYRVHIEFGDNGVVHLIAKIPDRGTDGAGAAARIAPVPMRGMAM